MLSMNRHSRRREKVFGRPAGDPLDGNAKARIMTFARCYSAKHRRQGQHRGPITRTYMEVLEALLWGFHNTRSGHCFPSYEAIAAKAGCSRDSVYEAIKALELAKVLTWVNCLVRTQERVRDLFGQWAWRSRVIRTSNAYLFRDPLPCQTPRDAGFSSKSENPTGTLIQDFILKKEPSASTPLDPDSRLERALEQMRRGVENRSSAHA